MFIRAVIKALRRRFRPLSAKQKDSLRRLALSEDSRNIQLAQSLAAGAGMSARQFERFRAAAIEADNIEGLDIVPPEKPVLIHSPETGPRLYFYHGYRLEMKEGWLGEWWKETPAGVVIWQSSGMRFEMRVPFLNPFPKRESERERVQGIIREIVAR
ncbi:MAG: hypothetical protein KDD28_15350 [Phaeodactylibacter sp.]|nr:hypothetical protein [Phaeodactylibacter sp.]